MATILCTLFNSLYLDKGLVLYDSLCENAKDFQLYVLCMDDKCYEVLTDLQQERLTPIRLEDFECEELLEVKPKRSFGEYCWTCSSWLISYIFEKYNPDNCTYIDADMYFYNDPAEIIVEMYSREASVLIVGHRFYPFLAEEKANIVGKYCVEFNTFKNDNNALHLLNKWKYQVLEHCSLDGDGVYWGDQKYMDNWPKDYGFVIETSHMGAGVAPWNISQYHLQSQGEEMIIRLNSNSFPLVFYHFENIKYLSKNKVNTGIECYWGIDKNLVRRLYIDYLKRIDKKKEMLKNSYGIDVLIKSHPGVNSKNVFFAERLLSFFKRFLNGMVNITGLPDHIRRFYICTLPTILYRKYKIVDF